MKSYGAMRRVMFIVLLSILGSYCFGAEQAVEQSSMFDRAVQSTYEFVIAIGSYCQHAWSHITQAIMGPPVQQDDQNVKIQIAVPFEANAYSGAIVENAQGVPHGLMDAHTTHDTHEQETHGHGHSENQCTSDNQKDCKSAQAGVFSTHFFDDTYYVNADRYGEIDMDDNSHYDVDSDPMTLVLD